MFLNADSESRSIPTSFMYFRKILSEPKRKPIYSFPVGMFQQIFVASEFFIRLIV